MSDLLLRIYVRALCRRQEAGQTVAEYALVLLVAAAIAAGFLLWAKSSGRLDEFFDAIFERLLSSVESEPSPSPAS
jgi:Flp pilus assembly pilin Flp